MFRVVTHIEDMKINDFYLQDQGEIGESDVETERIATLAGNNLAFMNGDNSFADTSFVQKTSLIDDDGTVGGFVDDVTWLVLVSLNATQNTVWREDNTDVFLKTYTEYYLIKHFNCGYNDEKSLFTFYNELTEDDEDDL